MMRECSSTCEIISVSTTTGSLIVVQQLSTKMDGAIRDTTTGSLSLLLLSMGGR